MVSGPILPCASPTAGVGRASSNSTNAVAGRSCAGSAVTTSSTSGDTVAAIARPNAVPLAANTRPGLRTSMMLLSFMKSCESSEYGTEIGA